jgi:hypothetical protein
VELDGGLRQLHDRDGGAARGHGDDDRRHRDRVGEAAHGDERILGAPLVSDEGTEHEQAGDDRQGDDGIGGVAAHELLDAEERRCAAAHQAAGNRPDATAPKMPSSRAFPFRRRIIAIAHDPRRWRGITGA